MEYASYAVERIELAISSMVHLKIIWKQARGVSFQVALCIIRGLNASGGIY